MKKSKNMMNIKMKSQNFQSMVNHSQRNSEFESQLEESQTVDKKMASKDKEH
ncbi:hypothetical protein Q5M85_17025 [Paraclostridium bifermentans]|nr:hypothetical protein [Paraclostridium bifermentans]